MHHDIGVGRAADLALHSLVIGQRIAVGTEQRAARCALQLPLVGLHVTLLEIDGAAAKAEQADHAIAIEELVVLELGRELRIRMNTVERAIELAGHFALDLQVQDVAFKAQGAKRATEATLGWEMGHRELSGTLDVALTTYGGALAWASLSWLSTTPPFRSAM